MMCHHIMLKYHQLCTFLQLFVRNYTSFLFLMDNFADETSNAIKPINLNL